MKTWITDNVLNKLVALGKEVRIPFSTTSGFLDSATVLKTYLTFCLFYSGYLCGPIAMPPILFQAGTLSVSGFDGRTMPLVSFL